MVTSNKRNGGDNIFCGFKEAPYGLNGRTFIPKLLGHFHGFTKRSTV